MTVDLTIALKNFLDAEGRLVRYPAKHKVKLLALFYLTGKFERGRVYSEKEVNQVLRNWHTFGDWAMLRRDLYDLRFLSRRADGSEYWLEEQQPTFEDFGLDTSK